VGGIDVEMMLWWEVDFRFVRSRYITKLMTLNSVRMQMLQDKEDDIFILDISHRPINGHIDQLRWGLKLLLATRQGLAFVLEDTNKCSVGCRWGQDIAESGKHCLQFNIYCNCLASSLSRGRSHYLMRLVIVEYLGRLQRVAYATRTKSGVLTTNLTLRSNCSTGYGKDMNPFFSLYLRLYVSIVFNFCMQFYSLQREYDSSEIPLRLLAN
jgi:hypothetical protein